MKKRHLRQQVMGISLLAFAFLASTSLFSQTSLSGRILSGKGAVPVASATVYIDGSSTGTSTDKEGNFKLNRITFPCLLVVSHVSYQLKTVRMDNAPATPLEIVLDEREREIGEVSVTGKNLRKENEEKFKKSFLGFQIDKWANAAHIENDDVLSFSRFTDTVSRKSDKFDYMAKMLGRPLKHTFWTNDSTVAECRNIFNTSTKSPLIVSIDKMGYIVHIDIDYYRIEEKERSEEQKTGIATWWNSYSYITSADSASIKDKKEIEQNRREAYFNSMRHFVHSLIGNNLEENGFLLPSVVPKTDKLRDARYDSYFDIRPYVIHFSDNETHIVGLKNKTFQIQYFCTGRNTPANSINKSGKINWWSFDAKNISYVTFLKDTCIFYRNGSSSDVTFSGAVTNKRIGSVILPDDYKPDNNDWK